MVRQPQVLDSLRLLETEAQQDKAHEAIAVLQRAGPKVAASLPDLVTDAAMALFAVYKATLQGVLSMHDTGAGVARDVLTCVHALFEAANTDDCTFRLSVAIKLALLLEEQELYAAAKAVLQQAKVAVENFRSHFLAATEGEADEHLRWISASRSQPSPDLTKLMESEWRDSSRFLLRT